MRVILEDYNTNTITWLKRNDEVAIPSYNNFFFKFFKKKKIPKPNDNTMNKYPIILRIVLHISTILSITVENSSITHTPSKTHILYHSFIVILLIFH